MQRMSDISDPAAEPNKDTPSSLPPWADCECFCIRNYTGTKLPPCGWRGRWRDVIAGSSSSDRRCPRCGAATLLEISPRAAARDR